MFVVAITFFKSKTLECVSMNNHECKVRAQILDNNSNNPFFHPYSIRGNKSSGNCKNRSRHQEVFLEKGFLKMCSKFTGEQPCRSATSIKLLNGPYAKLCVTDAVKNINFKVFNLMSRINETRHIKWHETCGFICRLDASVCNDKQRWNKDKCRCECKELVEKGHCDKEFIRILVIVNVSVINRIILEKI